MTERKLDLKNPLVAGLLAWLVPGAGHFYQKRHFKAAVYSFGILGTFLFGMALGDWRPVHWTEYTQGQRVKNWSFGLQMGVGTPGVVAYFQTSRFYAQDNRVAIINGDSLRQALHIGPEVGLPANPLEESIAAEFEGRLEDSELGDGQLMGRVTLEPRTRNFQGTFDGTLTLEDGTEKSVKLKLGQALFLDRKIVGAPRRRVLAREDSGGLLNGTVPRGVANWFAAPLDDSALADLHLRLNKRFEMALVFTWIAGLLNILAVWDAVQGPAYGFGDEPPPEKDSEKNKGKPDKNDAAQQQRTPEVKGGQPQPAASAGTAETAPIAGEKT